MNGRVIIKRNFGRSSGCEFGSFSSGQGPLAGCCVHANETYGTVKSEAFS